MSFNPNIPVITDRILQSARQIKSNFRAISRSFNENHVRLNSSEDIYGKHEALIFSTSSDRATSADETALYTKAVSSVPQLFFMPNSAQTPIQMTYPSIQTGLQSEDPDVYFDDQYSFVAGPFVIYMGQKSFTGTVQAVVLTPVTTLVHVDVCVRAGPNVGVASAINIVANTFDISYPVVNPAVTKRVFYLAVGV